MRFQINQEILKTLTYVQKATRKWKEYNRCPDRKKRDKLWDEYMDLVRAMELEVNK